LLLHNCANKQVYIFIDIQEKKDSKQQQKSQAIIQFTLTEKKIIENNQRDQDSINITDN
jgi:hypothetical protein